jgi:hypothetical protein
MKRYTVEDIEHTTAAWGEMFVANIRIANDVTLYRVGPAYSIEELLQQVLDRFGRAS